MPNASNAALYVEQGQTLNTWTAMTDSGDHKIFTTGTDHIWSGKSGKAPDIRPNGIVTGRNLLSTHADNDKVTVAAFTAYSQGVLRTVNAGTATISRASAPETHMITSVVMTSAGAIDVTAGLEGVAFSETRGAAGGPPLIAVDSVELGQVRVASASAAVVAEAEIFQTIGTHTERYDYPTWSVNNVGEGAAANDSDQTYAHVIFASATGANHTGPIARKVYIQYYEPTLSEVTRVLDFVPPETSYSVTSKQFYQGTVATSSSSLGQGTFTALLADGVSDSLVGDKGEVLTFKFFPDKDKAPYVLCQGTLGIARSFPVADQIQASCTITSEVGAAEFLS